eukprot:UN08554
MNLSQRRVALLDAGVTEARTMVNSQVTQMLKEIVKEFQKNYVVFQNLQASLEAQLRKFSFQNGQQLIKDLETITNETSKFYYERLLSIYGKLT